MKAPSLPKPTKAPDPLDSIPAPYLQMAAARMVALGRKVFQNQPNPTSPPVGPTGSQSQPS